MSLELSSHGWSAAPGVFRLVKFRTMTSPEPGRPQPDEARITRLGKMLRATSLDELPTLLNVIIGDMSLVGGPLLVEYFLPGERALTSGLQTTE